MGEPSDLVTLLDRGGVLAILVAIIVGGYRRWWVFGWAYDASQREVRYWRELALTAIDLGEAALRRRDEHEARRRFVDDRNAVERRNPDGSGGDWDA